MHWEMHATQCGLVYVALAGKIVGRMCLNMIGLFKCVNEDVSECDWLVLVVLVQGGPENKAVVFLYVLAFLVWDTKP